MDTSRDVCSKQNEDFDGVRDDWESSFAISYNGKDNKSLEPALTFQNASTKSIIGSCDWAKESTNANIKLASSTEAGYGNREYDLQSRSTLEHSSSEISRNNNTRVDVEEVERNDKVKRQCQTVKKVRNTDNNTYVKFGARPMDYTISCKFERSKGIEYNKNYDNFKGNAKYNNLRKCESVGHLHSKCHTEEDGIHQKTQIRQNTMSLIDNNYDVKNGARPKENATVNKFECRTDTENNKNDDNFKGKASHNKNKQHINKNPSDHNCSISNDTISNTTSKAEENKKPSITRNSKNELMKSFTKYGSVEQLNLKDKTKENNELALKVRKPIYKKASKIYARQDSKVSSELCSYSLGTALKKDGRCDNIMDGALDKHTELSVDDNIRMGKKEAEESPSPLHNKQGAAKSRTQQIRSKRKNKNSLEIKARKNKNKPTDLFAVVYDKVNDKTKLKNFLTLRMGKPVALDFDICEEETTELENGHLFVRMKFSCHKKALFARHKLSCSNRNTESKVYCYFDKNEALEQIQAINSFKSQIEQAILKILDQTKYAKNKHDSKIATRKSEIVTLKSKMSAKRGIKWHEFERMEDEKLALEDKLAELECQQREFIRYIGVLKVKLERLIDDTKPESTLRDIRKALGIECQRLEKALPLYSRREEILSIVRDHQVCVILGETGSGKSTQMVQYLYQADFARTGMIVCTQPRKVAAVNLATHVSRELVSSVGHIVGYQVGMQSKKTSETKIIFMTDHILLNECLKDRNLSKYSCIIIDEAHERSIHTDLLLGMIKQSLIKRPELKVVVTSATIDPNIFVQFFGGDKRCPVLKVSGRTFPVDVVWESDPQYDKPFPEDYESKVLEKAIELHTNKRIEDGDILAFLTSGLETENCVEKFKKRVTGNDYVCLQLHGKIDPREQEAVFKPNRDGYRKIVFATNSAETSITIPGVTFVIDTGVVKEMRYDHKKNMNSLDVVSVSRSSANQRKGRAGRTAPGICYRLYTEEDYNQMEECGTPEILRIEVCQAMLKLMDLGVDPMCFQYVQSPAPEAMNEALRELEELGAVENRIITTLGKWISKLPLEPKLSMLIKKGIDLNVPVETIVIACCCNQSGIFFRAGSQEEKKNADLKKLRFCHFGGDLLSMLNVYREWDKINEKGKGKWCSENCINGKVIKVVRNTVNEVIATLLKEHNLKIKHEFQDPSKVDNDVLKIVFQCMMSNLCYYLGHMDAGYMVINRLQRVQFHPSSSIYALGYQPNWAVFNRVLKTSADFIMEVTPVSQELIDEAVKENKITFDETYLKNMKVKNVYKGNVGKHVYWKCVGPMHKNRREIEEKLSSLCDNSLVIIDANKQRGQISLYCVPVFKDLAVSFLKETLLEMSASLLNESKEEPLGDPKGGIRALLRTGGSVVDVLMPHQYRVLNVKENQYSTYILSEQTVADIVSVYGPVEQIWRPNGKKNRTNFIWGRVTFTNAHDAVVAAEYVNKDPENGFDLAPITFEFQMSRQQPEYTMKLCWCRRPGKGHCYVYLDRPEDMATLLSSENIRVKERYVSVSVPKQQSDLFIKNIGSEDTEDDVIFGLANALGVSLDSCKDRFRVVIPRDNTSYRSNEMEIVHDMLYDTIARYIPVHSFKLNVKEYKAKTVKAAAFVRFSDPETCLDLAECITTNDCSVDGHRLVVHTEFKSHVYVSGKLYELLRQDVENYIDKYKRKQSSTTIQIRQLKSGNISIDLVAKSPKRLARHKVKIDKIVDGDVFECTVDNKLSLLFSRDGHHNVRQIQQATQVLIIVDERQMKVVIQGKVSYRAKAVAMMWEYVEKNAAMSETEICLKGDTNPRGLMKALYIRYGTGFQELVQDAQLQNILVNIRAHTVTLVGKVEAIDKAIQMIDFVKNELAKCENVELVFTDLPECSVCLCAVEEADMSQLEYCGHVYCKICLKSMFQNAITDKKFPIICAAIDCNKPIVMRDVNTQIKLHNFKKDEFTAAALHSFMTQSHESFRYCITPDCSVVYHVTETTERFQCFQCLAVVCTACHTRFHEGMTCAMYRSAQRTVDSLDKWQQEKPKRRKFCPKCQIGIQKGKGCNHVACKCGAHICWVCLKYFELSPDCYGHLKNEHGSFV